MMTPVHIEREGAPSKEELQNLLTLIGDFRTNKPYETIESSDFFGIRQEDGTINWCIIMGSAGMEFGLSLFYGTKSLDAFQELLEDPHCPDCYPFRDLDGVYFNLVNKNELESIDLTNLKELNFKTFGRGKGWPLLRRYIPGHTTSEVISKKDYDSLKEVLTLMPEIVEDYIAKKMTWPIDEIDELYPVLSIKNGERIWETICPDFHDDDEEEIEIHLDEFTTAKLPKLKAVENTLFVGSPILFMPIQETNPPYLPEASIVMDASSAMVLDFGIVEDRENTYAAKAKNVAAFLLRENVRPAEIFFDCPVLANCFEKIYENTETTIDCYPAPDFYLDMLDEMLMMSGGM